MDLSKMYNASDFTSLRPDRMGLSVNDSGSLLMSVVKPEIMDRPNSSNSLELPSAELDKFLIGGLTTENVTTSITPQLDTDCEHSSRQLTDISSCRPVPLSSKDQQPLSGFDAALKRLYRERGHPCASTALPADSNTPSYKQENPPSSNRDVIPPFDLSDQRVPCRTPTHVGNSNAFAGEHAVAFREDHQEKLKLEHRRARNREAAIRCRTKKLRRISDMEVRVKDLRKQNSELSTTISSHKKEIIRLKKIILEHSHQGCGVMTSVMQ